jgi:hypothetical protein
VEAFVPIAPHLLLVMSWVAGRDHPALVTGDGRHIATAKAFVVANADAQWFHKPDAEPWRLPAGPRGPLSVDLIPGYGVDVASGSKR